MGDIRLGTKCKNMIKRGLCLVLTLLMTVILASPVIAAPADNGSIEMVAAFDKISYTAGETVKVSVTVYGSEFDAAGLHLTYDSNSRVQYASQKSTGKCFGSHGAEHIRAESWK